MSEVEDGENFSNWVILGRAEWMWMMDCQSLAQTYCRGCLLKQIVTTALLIMRSMLGEWIAVIVKCGIMM